LGVGGVKTLGLDSDDIVQESQDNELQLVVRQLENQVCEDRDAEGKQYEEDDGDSDDSKEYAEDDEDGESEEPKAQS
jgi:hypothetical protein